jgi:hypothetical protein
MEAEIIVAYVVCDDTIKFLGIKKACRTLKAPRYFPTNMLSKSQLNRRLLRITKDVWDAILERLSLELGPKKPQNS